MGELVFRVIGFEEGRAMMRLACPTQRINSKAIAARQFNTSPPARRGKKPTCAQSCRMTAASLSGIFEFFPPRNRVYSSTGVNRAVCSCADAFGTNILICSVQVVFDGLVSTG
jgi:hypothetical protein